MTKIFYPSVSFSSILFTLFITLSTGCITPEENLAMKRNEAHILATDFNDTMAVVVDGFEAKPGGTLFYIEKKDGQWRLQQTIDLDGILTAHSPLAVVCNRQWMVLSNIPKHQGDPAKIVLFKNTGGHWTEVPTPDSMSSLKFSGYFHSGEPVKSIALSQENQLYIGQSYDKSPNGKGKVLHFDLNESPIVTRDPILPPKDSIVRSSSGGFGASVTLRENTMIVKDISAAYSEEEIKRYGLTVDDIVKTYSSDGALEPPNKNSILAYNYDSQNKKWEYVTDFFKELPHPKDGILRNPIEYRSPNRKEVMYHSSEDISLPFQVTSDRAYFYSFFYFYVFKTIDGSAWEFEKRITPPNHTDPLKRNFNYTAFYHIGEKYTIYFSRDTGCFDVYRTDQLENWDVIWTVPFDTVQCPRVRKSERKKIYATGITIADDSILIYYLLRTYNPNTSESRSRGKIVIYDVDPQKGPMESFVMKLGPGHDTFRILQ